MTATVCSTAGLASAGEAFDLVDIQEDEPSAPLPATPPPRRLAPMMEWATWYAQHQCPVLPLHGVHEKHVGDNAEGEPIFEYSCGCGNPQCENIGKQAWNIAGIFEHGAVSATVDPEGLAVGWGQCLSPAEVAAKGEEKATRRHRRHRNNNIGLATGAAGGFFVIDIDVKHGGLETWLSLCAEHETPATLFQKTGGGGYQYFFAYPEGMTIANSTGTPSRPGPLGPGIDIRGDNGYVVAPPSIHHSGGSYRWENFDQARPLREQIHPAPEWILGRIATRKATAPAATARPSGKALVNFEIIYAQCPWARHCVEDAATLGEEEWYQFLGLLTFCEGGSELALTYSRPHPKFSARETAQKFAHADDGFSAGAPRCASINSAACAGCPHPGSAVQSPVGLAPVRRTRTAHNPPKIWTARELAAAVFPEPQWAIPDLLPEGLTILAGRPKVGKSWLALCLALGVAHGGRVLGKIDMPRAREVLYLGLEDNERRLQDRMRQLVDVMPETLHLATTWPRGDDGIAALRAFLDAHPNTGLVIVDTWQKIRPMTAGHGRVDPYTETSAELGALKALADEYHIALVLVHHERKSRIDDSGGDFLESVLGSTGIVGAADTIIALGRQRGAADGMLKATGRDLREDLELALARDERAGWQIMGDAAEYALSQERRNILAVMPQDGTAITPKEILAALGVSEAQAGGRIRKLLFAMTSAGTLQKVGYGQYKITGNTGNTGNSGITGNSGNTSLVFEEEDDGEE